MTRHILILAAGLSLALGASSCKDYLNTSPSSSETTSEVLKEYDLLESVTIGMYDALQGGYTANTYYACQFLLAADVMGDDLQTTPTGSRGNSYYLMNYAADYNLGCWKQAYLCIREANRLMEMCDNVEAELKAHPLSKDTQAARLKHIAQARAEALATRALAHFDLLRQYATPYPFSDGGKALGVPLVLTAEDAKSLPGRSSVGEVYKQIIEDFTEALKGGALPDTKYGRFSSSAVKALLARVYLYMNTPEGNQKALELSKEVIDSKAYALALTEEDYKQVWSEPRSKEMIFTISNFDSNDWGDREGLPYVLSPSGYRNAHLTKKFYDEMMTDPNDLRWSVLSSSRGTEAKDYAVKLSDVTEDTKIWIGKYPGKSAYGDMRTNDIPVIRLAEVYMNAAEAAFKLGQTATALSYLNAIVQRANPAKEVTASELSLERILAERAKEFVGEGHRFFDLMRTGMRCERFVTGNPGWHNALTEESRSFDHTYFRSILPIPQVECDVNTVLKAQQNPGY